MLNRNWLDAPAQGMERWDALEKRIETTEAIMDKVRRMVGCDVQLAHTLLDIATAVRNAKECRRE